MVTVVSYDGLVFYGQLLVSVCFILFFGITLILRNSWSLWFFSLWYFFTSFFMFGRCWSVCGVPVNYFLELLVTVVSLYQSCYVR